MIFRELQLQDEPDLSNNANALRSRKAEVQERIAYPAFTEVLLPWRFVG
jgi:hypothetical protein